MPHGGQISRKDTSVAAWSVWVCLVVEFVLMGIYLTDLGLTYLCLGLRRFARTRFMR